MSCGSRERRIIGQLPPQPFAFLCRLHQINELDRNCPQHAAPEQAPKPQQARERAPPPQLREPVAGALATGAGLAREREQEWGWKPAQAWSETAGRGCRRHGSMAPGCRSRNGAIRAQIGVNFRRARRGLRFGFKLGEASETAPGWRCTSGLAIHLRQRRSLRRGQSPAPVPESSRA